jgi:hypothetical protein
MLGGLIKVRGEVAFLEEKSFYIITDGRCKIELTD